MDIAHAVARYEEEDSLQHPWGRKIPHLMLLQVNTRTHPQTSRGHGPRKGGARAAANLDEVGTFDEHSAGSSARKPR